MVSRKGVAVLAGWEEKDRLDNLAERGGFEPPVEVLAPTTV
jgi:hypothetical protein